MDSLTAAVAPTSTPEPGTPAPGTRDTAPAHAAATPPLLAQATRLAVLRRLGPALRHEATGLLQPIAMSASLLDRRLESLPTDNAAVREGVQRLVGYARKAVQANLELISWLVPDPRAHRPLEAAVQEVLGLMATPLGLDGFRLQPQLHSQAVSALVSQSAVRCLLPACLWWLSDQSPIPGVLQLTATRQGTSIVLTLQLLANAASAPLERATYSPPSRPPPQLSWPGLVALAVAEDCTLQEKGQALELGLPCTER